MNDVLWPGANVSGVVMPDMLKPVPLTVATEMIALVSPVFFMLSAWVELWPDCTLPKEMLEGVAVSMAGVNPLPESAISMAFDPLTVSDIFPFAAPPVVGINTTPKVELWLGASVSGRLNPL